MSTLSSDHAPSHRDQGQKPLSNFTLRILTGLIGGPIVLALAVSGGWPFVGLAVGLVVVALLEFYALGRGQGLQGAALIGIPIGVMVVILLFIHQDTLAVTVLGIGPLATFLLETARHPRAVRGNLLCTAITGAGLLYIAVPAGLIVVLRHLSDGLVWLSVVLAITWGTDIFAYIGGRLWGKTQLAPTISPKKTLEGALVGIVGGMTPTLIVLMIAGKLTPTTLALPLLGPLVAILGDLVESALKRLFHTKDSHLAGFDVLPGHGGVLDRVDALVLVTVFCYVFLVLMGVAR